MPTNEKKPVYRRYCDDCQLELHECPPTCEGYIEREYRKAMTEWEQSADWMETNPY